MILGFFIYLFVGMGVGLGCDIIKDLGNWMYFECLVYLKIFTDC